MKIIRFKKWGWLYSPVHPPGVVITVLAMLFPVPVYAAMVRNGHSVSDDLYNMFVYTTCPLFWWDRVAKKMGSNGI